MTKPLRFENKSLRLKFKCLICIWIIFWAILDLSINPKYLFQNKSFSQTYYFKSEKSFVILTSLLGLKINPGNLESSLSVTTFYETYVAGRRNLDVYFKNRCYIAECFMCALFKVCGKVLRNGKKQCCRNACKLVKIQVSKSHLSLHVMLRLSKQVSRVNFIPLSERVWQQMRLHNAGPHFNYVFCIAPGGPLVFQVGYHPRKRTFKTHPKHVFFRYENRP